MVQNGWNGRPACFDTFGDYHPQSVNSAGDIVIVVCHPRLSHHSVEERPATCDIAYVIAAHFSRFGQALVRI
jgi:hypothetical protein